MPLDPQARSFLDRIARKGGLNLSRLSPEEARRVVTQMRPPSAGEPVARIEERSVPGPDGPIPLRVYRPAVTSGLEPGILYLHAGGWVLGDLDSGDGVCRALANRVRAAVISVGYRLAPEHPYPAGLLDCFAATRWAAEHGATLGVDGARLAIVGDSAGGNLAAVVALMARDQGAPELRHQVLICPVTDCDFDTHSYREHGVDYLLTREDLQWFWGHYLPDPGRRRDAHASPLRAASLAGVAPATVITAELDPVRDEGEAYAARLREAGVAVTCTRHDGQMHGFVGLFSICDQGRVAVDEIACVLRDVLHP